MGEACAWLRPQFVNPRVGGTRSGGGRKATWWAQRRQEEWAKGKSGKPSYGASFRRLLKPLATPSPGSADS
ncbi:unnamed protein product [Lampetra fluviatilis]